MSEIGLWLTLACSAALYGLGVRRARRWPWRRTVAWGGALVTVGVSLGTLDHLAHRSMHAHMLQHLLLINLAAPLAVAGAPVALMLRAPGPLRAPVARLLHSRVLAVVLHPAVAVTLFSVVVAGSHYPAFYDAALDHPLLHVAEHSAYLAVAFLFWTMVLGIRPMPVRRSPLIRIVALLAAMPPMALVGVGIMSTSRPAYTHYALPDQHGAGRLMWVGGTLPMGALVLVIGASGALEEERRQQRREALAAARPAGVAR